MRTHPAPFRAEFVSRPDLTPLNYLAVLILFGLLAFPTMGGCLFLTLPRATTAEWVMTNRPTVYVSTRREVGYFVQGQRSPVASAQLARAIEQVVAGREGRSRTIQVIADRNAPYSEVLNVLDAAREAGVQRLELWADAPRPTPEH